MTHHFTFIETPRLLIRRFQSSDAPTLVAYRNDPEVAKFQSWEMIDEALARQFIAETVADDPGVSGSGFQFAIERKSVSQHIGDHIGDLYLRTLDWDARQAELGYTLTRQAQGNGYASEAVAALLEYCFATLNLHRVVAIAALANSSSIKLAERLGMRREAYTVKSMAYRGEYVDEVQYAILAEEWRSEG